MTPAEWDEITTGAFWDWFNDPTKVGEPTKDIDAFKAGVAWGKKHERERWKAIVKSIAGIMDSLT